MPSKYRKNNKKVNPFKDSFGIDAKQLFVFSLSFFLIVVLLCFGLWGYKIYLDKDIEESTKETEILQGQRDLDLEDGFVKLKINIEDLKKISEAHVYPSKIFELLEELTIPQIRFIGFDANLSESKLIIEAESLDYNNLAKQIVVFEESQNIETVDLSKVDLSESGKVESNLEIKIDSNFLHFKDY